MRIFVCEYITGGGMSGSPLPPSLAHEGDLMLGALLRDLSDLNTPEEGLQVIISRDERLAVPSGKFCDMRIPEKGADIWAFWERVMEDCDALFAIAPESDEALERLSLMAREKNCLLLGSTPETVALAANKFHTARWLTAQGIETPPTYRFSNSLPDSPTGYIAKPHDGAGATETRFFQEREALDAWMNPQRRESHIIQPFIPGLPASLTGLFKNGQACLLSCNRQDIVFEDDMPHYRGFDVGALEEARPLLAPLADNIAAVFPGLWGIAGIDLILSDDGPVVLEINPRLTTPYAALRDALSCNPAGLVLDLLKNESLPPAPQVPPARQSRLEVDAAMSTP